MERYSREQRIQIIKVHYKNYENFTNTCRELRALFGNDEAPSQQIITNLIKNFESVGHVGDVKTPAPNSKAKPAKTITNVIERLAENQADRANESESAATSDRLDPSQSANPQSESGSGTNNNEKAANPRRQPRLRTAGGNNENESKTNNAKPSRKAKRPRHR